MSDDKPNSENIINASDSGSVPIPVSGGVTFQGNNYDLLSIVGVTIGGIVLLSCATLNFGWYCLPVISIILGAIGLAMAKESVNPERTRLLSWISLGSGAAILALIILAIIAYIVIIIAVAADSGGF